MSEIKVNKISPRSGTTVTLGDSGDTFTIPSGATITNNGTANNFGADGAVNWQTGSLKTSTFTAVSGEGYFINQGSAITANLPAGSAGAIVAFSDYARNFATYNFTISPNGSEKIGGIAEDLILNVNGQALTLVYVDSTKGWINVQNAEDTETGAPLFLTATGGTETTCGDFKIHTFTGPGTFCVSAIAPGPSGNPNSVDYLVIAGGGAGGQDNGGGGGAGGVRFSDGTFDNSPAPSNPRGCTASLTASAGAFPITVGSGGAAGTCAARGNNSIFAGPSTITSTGGGGGAKCGAGNPNSPGGSGGGSGQNPSSQGSGNTPSVSPSQGSDGGPQGPSSTGGGSGGGGFMTAGATSPSTRGAGGGGTGGGFIPTAFGPSGVPCGSFKYYGGGGGGGAGEPAGGGPGSPGLGGGGEGGGDGASGQAGLPGTANTGGGGGGGGSGGSQPGGTGGSGIVVIRYKFQ